jgi:hypothetical protein
MASLSLVSRTLRRLPAVGRLGSARAASSHVTTHYKKIDRETDERWAEVDMERFADETDVLIVGGGPSVRRDPRWPRVPACCVGARL